MEDFSGGEKVQLLIGLGVRHILNCFAQFFACMGQ